MKDERKAHEKLSRSNMAKEHFELDAVTAVIRVRSILKREPAFIHKSIEAAVAERREELRQKARKRFGVDPEPVKTEQSAPGADRDLFAPLEPKAEAQKRETSEVRKKGFLANLFP
ncbi:hypothetical protein G7A66_11075 [Altererythrobacter sp. SALINAS58]|nr:hypothetical protein [Alteripontixanthobacter muriae]